MFKQVGIIGVAASIAAAGSTPNNRDAPPDAEKSFAEICAENGFVHEEHTVTTEDGYILSMYRIPG